MLITKENLLISGYVERTWYDTDSHTDTFKTLKFVEFSRQITPDARIALTFAYKASKENRYKFLERSMELILCNTEGIQLNCSLGELKTLADILSKKSKLKKINNHA